MTPLALFILMVLIASSSQTLGNDRPQPGSIPALATLQADPSQLVTNYAINTSNSVPNAIIAGADNHTFWFTEFGAGKIGEFNTLTKTVIREFAVSQDAMPATLALDRRGLIWFTDESQKSPSVWSLNTTSGKLQQYPTNLSPSDPIFVLVDPTSDYIWFTDYYGNYLGEITGPNATPLRYNLPSSNSYPVEIAKENGTSYLWLTEATGKIARFDMSTDQFLEYSPTVVLSFPVGIVVDKSSNVWVSEHGGSSVTEFIQSNSTWRKYPTSQASAPPGTGVATLAIDSTGRLWFAEHYSNRIGRLDPSTGEMNEFQLPIPGAYSLLDTVDSQGNFWFTEAAANQIGMISGNATGLVDTKPVTLPSGGVTSGSSTSVTFTIKNENQTSQVKFSLNVTSSFTANYYTTKSEVSLSTYSLTLGPGQNQNVTAVLTPDFSLGSGLYTAGIVATHDNISSIGTVFLQVNANPLYQLETLLPEILIAAGAVLLVVLLITSQRRKHGRARKQVAPPKTTAPLILLVLFLSLVGETDFAWGKCPGLPPPPTSGGPDPYGIALDIGSVAFFAIVAYFLIRSRLRGQSPPSTERQDQTS